MQIFFYFCDIWEIICNIMKRKYLRQIIWNWNKQSLLQTLFKDLNIIWDWTETFGKFNAEMCSVLPNTVQPTSIIRLQCRAVL